KPSCSSVSRMRKRKVASSSTMRMTEASLVSGGLMLGPHQFLEPAQGRLEVAVEGPQHRLHLLGRALAPERLDVLGAGGEVHGTQVGGTRLEAVRRPPAGLRIAARH